MAARPPRQVRFVRAQVEKVGADRCAAQVELLGAAAGYQGQAEGGSVDADGLRSAARAATRALRHLGHSVEIDAVEVIQALGEPAVAVRVSARHEGETRTLVGFCLTGNDPVKAAVRAVLNATNRFLDIG